MSTAPAWATKTTTDHAAIRKWAQARDATPAHVTETATDDDVGVLRLDFPEAEPDTRLEEVSWEQFFEKFDRERLAFRHQNQKKNGELSHFHRFIRREETGVTDAVEADVATVVVAQTPVPAAAAGDADTGTEVTVGLVVDEIHENALGYDHWNRNDEFLVFRNEGDEPLDLTGWTVENEDGDSYTFPDAFTLQPDTGVTLHTGEGDDSDTHLYWNADRARWKNTGDTVAVSDPDGHLHIHETY